MGSNDNRERTHSNEQGLRVHHLANLGGLVALAGLDNEPPDFLLGALLSVARDATTLTPDQRRKLSEFGGKRLKERATGKRAWKSWIRAQALHPLTLSTSQVAEIIEALGGNPPDDPTKLPLALSQMLSEMSDG